MSRPPLQLHVMFLLTCALDFTQIDHSRIWIRAGGDSSCDGDRGDWRPGVHVQPGENAPIVVFFCVCVCGGDALHVESTIA